MVEVRRLRACQRMVGFAILTLVVSNAAHAQGQQPASTGVLTLQEALEFARARSEQVAIARAGVTRAEGGELRARSERLPQLSFVGSYDRALASEFEGLFDNIDFGGGGTPGEPDLGNLPFGRENTYRVGLTFSQNLFAGGRIRAQEQQARLARTTATIGVATTTAQLELDVARAFYDAALSDRLVSIAEATYGQADQTFELTRVQREAGRQSEFEQLRAQVARDTLQPQVIRQRANRDVAYMRLKQLLELPLEAAVRLAAELENDLLPPDPAFATDAGEGGIGPADPSSGAGRGKDRDRVARGGYRRGSGAALGVGRSDVVLRTCCLSARGRVPDGLSDELDRWGEWIGAHFDGWTDQG